MDINQALGLAIKEILNEEKIKRIELVERTKLSRAFIYMVLEGKTSPSLNAVQIISDALNISIGRLLSKANQIRNSK